MSDPYHFYDTYDPTRGLYGYLDRDPNPIWFGPGSEAVRDQYSASSDQYFCIHHYLTCDPDTDKTFAIEPAPTYPYL